MSSLLSMQAHDHFHLADPPERAGSILACTMKEMKYGALMCCRPRHPAIFAISSLFVMHSDSDALECVELLHKLKNPASICLKHFRRRNGAGTSMPGTMPLSLKTRWVTCGFWALNVLHLQCRPSAKKGASCGQQMGPPHSGSVPFIAGARPNSNEQSEYSKGLAPRALCESRAGRRSRDHASSRHQAILSGNLAENQKDQAPVGSALIVVHACAVRPCPLYSRRVIS
jgi:hypothetical protein